MDMETETSSTPEGTSVDATDQIADILMGNDEETETEDSVDEETLPEESTESDDSDEESEAEDADSEEDAEAEPEPEVEAEADESWESVLGVEEDKLSFDDNGNVAGVKVKIDGETSTVPMADLITGYQTNKHVTQQSQKLAEQRKEFESQYQGIVDNYTAKLENAEVLTEYLGKQVTQQFDSVNWEQLRIEDPAEYAALRQDYATRAQEIQQAQEAIKTEKQEQTQVSSQKNVAQMQAYIESEKTKMLANNPAWVDPDTLSKDMKALRGFGVEQYGFTEGDFDRVTDSRLIEVIKDAQAYREGVKISTRKVKRPVPKFQKSKGVPTKKVSKLDKLTKKAQGLAGANKRSAQTDAIAELLGG